MRPDTLSISLYNISSLLLSPFFFLSITKISFYNLDVFLYISNVLRERLSTNQSIPLFCPFLFPHTYFNSVLYVRDDQRNDSVL